MSYKTPKMPKISVVKQADITTPSLAISGKNVFKEKNNIFANNTNNNEFTFSPREMREAEYLSAKKPNVPKNPFEKNMGQNQDPYASISKNEMFEKLGIYNPQAEQVAELSVPNPGMSLPKNKQEAAKSLISNLETEIEKLKYKRDTYIANKEKERREQRERELAKRQPYDEEEAQVILHKDVERMQQLNHPISSLEKPTLDNVEALLRAHREKMQNIEQQYMEKKKHMILSGVEEDVRDSKLATGPISGRDVETIKLGKENKSLYERPKSSKYYSKKKHYEPERQTKAAQKAKDKEAYKREYEKKFRNYLGDKRDEVEHEKSNSPKKKKKDFDLYAPTSPDPKRNKTKSKWTCMNEDPDHDHERDDHPHEHSHSPREEQYRSSKLNTVNPGNMKVSTVKSDKAYKEATKGASPKRGRSPSRSPRKDKMKTSSPNSKNKRPHEESSHEFTESEEKLLLWVFNIMRKDNSETVDKEDICEYVLKSPQILELYDVDAANLRANLYAFRTDTRDAMRFEEFLRFLMNSRLIAEGKIEYTTEEQIKMSKSSMKKSGVRFTDGKSPGRSPGKKAIPKENVCMLSEEALDTMKEIFHEVDKYEDLIVKRLALIKRLREDVRIARILHKPAVHIVEIDKYLSLERLLRQIEEEETTALADQKKSKEYVSLNQFLRYFTNYETPDDLAEKMGEKVLSPKKSPRTQKAMEEDDQDVMELAPKQVKFLKDKFDAQPKKRNAFAETIQLIDAIRGDDSYKVYRYDPGRRKAMKFTLPNENIEEVLNRIEDEAEKYISWEDFVQFFTRRGRPRRLMTTTYNIEEDMIKTGLASNPKDQGLQTGAKLVQNIQRDGYDSDPEFHTYSKDINYEFRLNRTEAREELRSGKEMSPRRIGREEQSPKRSGSPSRSPSPTRSGKDQMTQIRLDTNQTSNRLSTKEKERERDRERSREREREREREAMSPYRVRAQTAARREREREWDESPHRRNRSASFDDKRELEDEYPDEIYQEDRGRKMDNKWLNRSHDERFGARYKDPTGLRYTVPDPFEFDTREKVRAKSIRERRVEEMVREKQEEEERMRRHHFRPKSVPAIVKEPLFERLMHEQEQRRAVVKKNSIAITKMREAPFEFYIRDKEKPKRGEPPMHPEFSKRFKAQPIPAICQLTDVWKNMKEREEIERREKVARLAQQNLLLASLPPRMAKHEKEKKEQELKSQINERNMERQRDKKTFVANEVPDFERLHKQFQEHLDRKRRNKRPTEAKPFHFQESKKGVTRDYLDVENKYRKAAKDETKRDPFESVRKLKETKPKLQPHTTKKMIALADLRKKEREEKQRRNEELEKEEEERKARYKKMKPLVQGSSAIVDNTLEKQERAEQIKKEVKQRLAQDQKNFEEKKKTIDEHVAKRPLLVEQEVERNKKVQLQAMKDLSKLNKIMREAGVKDPKQYFTQEERDKLEDAEYLQKRGFKEMRDDDD